MAKPALVFLCHRIPYPPDKGDKIRAYHALKFLAERYKVYLGTFIDDAEDYKHRGVLQDICEDCFFVPLKPGVAKVRSLLGLFTGKPLSVAYYANNALEQWGRSVLEANTDSRIFIFSSSMAQHAAPLLSQSKAAVADLVDIDSDKWQQYASDSQWPFKYIYKREAKYLSRVEKSIVDDFNFSFFVSRAEAQQFSSTAPALSHKVGWFSNGVDMAYFSRSDDLISPYSAQTQAIVFTGAMDYRPNIQAVKWFAGEVLPRVQQQYPQVEFYIVGTRPTKDVSDLASTAITVTGRVEDVRPYLQHASVAVAPMMMGRGIQNKVLEAMAMGTPVITTGLGAEGIENALPEQHIHVADTADDFARSVESVLGGVANPTGQRARELIVEDFNWNACLGKLETHLGCAY